MTNWKIDYWSESGNKKSSFYCEEIMLIVAGNKKSQEKDIKNARTRLRNLERM